MKFTALISSLRTVLQSALTVLILLLVGTPARGATLVGHWTFEGGGISDLTGNFADGTLVGGASVVDGHLELPNGGGTQYYRTGAYSGTSMTEKTLVTWVRLDDLTARGGSALTFQKNNGSEFDGVVFGEAIEAQWMTGSEFWNRTIADNGGALETQTDPNLVQIAITYADAGGGAAEITLYRDGVVYGTPYTKGSLLTFDNSSGTDVIFGLRHMGGGGSSFKGSIEEARIYSGLLTQTEVANLTTVPEPQSMMLMSIAFLAGAILFRRRC